MIDSALACLAAQLDAHLQARAGTGPGRVVLARLVDDNGKWAISDDSIGVALVNVLMDHVHEPAAPVRSLEPGGVAASAPALNLNLSVLFAAQSRQYPAALNHLTHVLAFFNEHPVFRRDQYPALGPGVQMVEVTLEPLDYEQLSRVWACVGGKQVPSVVYRIRLIAG
jgi:hypothetical protein